MGRGGVKRNVWVCVELSRPKATDLGTSTVFVSASSPHTFDGRLSQGRLTPGIPSLRGSTVENGDISGRRAGRVGER